MFLLSFLVKKNCKLKSWKLERLGAGILMIRDEWWMMETFQNSVSNNKIIIFDIMKTAKVQNITNWL